MTWRWRSRSNTESADLGNPLLDTDYAFCVYDELAGTSSLAASEALGAATLCADENCWRAKAYGFRFQDKDRTTRGLLELTLTVRPGRSASMTLRAKRDKVHLPVPVDETQLFRQETDVVAQLVNSTGACWEAIYSTPARRNTAHRFSDRAP